MKVLLSGNEAIARGAFEANCAVACAYPGTPSTEILETIGKSYPEISSAWTANEKTALETAYGAAMAGGRALACMKHVGLNVAADPLFTAAYNGVKKGFVIVTADDPSMHSSQNEQDNRRYGVFAKIPVLEPANSQEAKDFTKLAFQISEAFDIPVIIRLTTLISHTKTVVEINDPIREETKFEFDFADGKFMSLPYLARIHHKQLEEKIKKIREYNNTSELNKLEMKDTRLGIVTSALTYNYVKEAFPEASILKLGMVFPIPVKLIEDFRSKVEKMYVIEELEPVIEEQIKFFNIKVDAGKDKVPIYFELSVDILNEIFHNKKQKTYEVPELPSRPPVLCPGCPHRGVYFSLNKSKSYVNGDIGCYTLGFMPPLNAMHTCICMGASITNANGFEMIKQRANDDTKVVATIGDSTFIHSGITGLIDAVYNKLNTTVIILDNDITAMTGHQPNPVTGIKINGEKTTRLDLEKVCKAVGVKEVDRINPYDLKETKEVLNKHLNLKEPSVIISSAPCALLPTGVKNPPYYIDQDACTKCKACLKIGCPAIFYDGEKVYIDRFLCTGCSLCAQVCPFNAIKQEDSNDK